MEKAPFEFGITYVLNPNDGEKEIRAHLQNIREMGFTMIRTFLPWDGVEFADGVFEFGMFDSIHDIAAELGLHILESFSIYPPCWLREKLFEAYRKVVPFVDNDMVMYPHIASSVKFLNEYELAH